MFVCSNSVQSVTKLVVIMKQVLGGKVHLWCDTGSYYNLFRLFSNVNLSNANQSLNTTFVLDLIYSILPKVKGKLLKSEDWRCNKKQKCRQKYAKINTQSWKGFLRRNIYSHFPQTRWSKGPLPQQTVAFCISLTGLLVFWVKTRLIPGQSCYQTHKGLKMPQAHRITNNCKFVHPVQ